MPKSDMHVHGQGNCQLASQVHQFEVTHINICDETEEEKEKLFTDFIRYKPKKRPAVSNDDFNRL